MLLIAFCRHVFESRHAAIGVDGSPSAGERREHACLPATEQTHEKADSRPSVSSAN